MADETIEKINVYKLKGTITDYAEFVKTKDGKKTDLPGLEQLTLPQIDGFDGVVEAKAAYKETGGKQKTDADIPWLAFINKGNPGGAKFNFKWTNKAPSAILVVKIIAGGETSFFALTFGLAGDSFLDHEKIVHDFGIKVAMNICAENQLKRIQTSIHEAVSTQTERQISSNSSLSTFNMNAEKEFLRMLSGSSTADYPYISSFKGKESITIKVDKKYPLTWETLIPRLHELGTVASSQRYKKIFTEYDKFPFENDPAEITKLDAKLFYEIKSKNYDKIHLSPPTFFDYDNNMFVYKDEGDDTKYFEDLSLSDLLSFRKKDFRDGADISAIKNMRIWEYNPENGTLLSRWSAYKCIVAEVLLDNNIYILSLGQWRRVSADLKSQVETFVGGISITKPAFLPEGISIWNANAKLKPDGNYKGENQESVFNKHAADKSADLFLFDKGKVEIADEKRYEVCDLLHASKKFIQVKRYSSGSASISHLFVQARFYADAFLFDEKCRKSMRDHIIAESGDKDVTVFKDILPNDRTAIDAKDYTSCLCILSDKDDFKVSSLPFMAQYELMHTMRHLTNLGMKGELVFRKVQFGP